MPLHHLAVDANSYNLIVTKYIRLNIRIPPHTRDNETPVEITFQGMMEMSIGNPLNIRTDVDPHERPLIVDEDESSVRHKIRVLRLESACMLDYRKIGFLANFMRVRIPALNNGVV